MQQSQSKCITCQQVITNGQVIAGNFYCQQCAKQLKQLQLKHHSKVDPDNTKSIFRWYFSDPWTIFWRIIIFLIVWYYIVNFSWQVIRLVIGGFLANPGWTIVFGLLGFFFFAFIPVYTAWGTFKYIPQVWEHKLWNVFLKLLTTIGLLIGLVLLHAAVYWIIDYILFWLVNS